LTCAKPRGSARIMNPDRADIMAALGRSHADPGSRAWDHREATYWVCVDAASNFAVDGALGLIAWGWLMHRLRCWLSVDRAWKTGTEHLHLKSDVFRCGTRHLGSPFQHFAVSWRQRLCSDSHSCCPPLKYRIYMRFSSVASLVAAALPVFASACAVLGTASNSVSAFAKRDIASIVLTDFGDSTTCVGCEV